MRKNAALALAVTAALASAAGAMAQGVTTDHLAALDANGDGVLTVTEASEIIPAEAFAAADTNGDGKLSAQEFATTVMADFAKADLDGDGRLN